MSDTRTAPPAWRLPTRLAYVVSHSRPHSSNGYAVRTHQVAAALARAGHEVIVINRPGRPWDIEGFPLTAEVEVDQVIDGVRYMFLPLPEGEDRARGRQRRAERALIEAFEVLRPAAVIAASNWETAAPAQGAARRLELPFFYEQRGFWEMSRAASEPGFETTAEYAANRDRDTAVARSAQAVFTLTGAMRAELERRGVPSARIHLVPNGAGWPAPHRGGPSRDAIGLTARHVLGYVGSLSAYEGVEDLVRLVARLRGNGEDVAALVVGSDAPKGLVATREGGSAVAGLRALAEELGVADRLHVASQVPAEEVGGWYGLLDAVVLPRRRSAATEMVAPLKPYEAAAYGLPVFMTDMPPLDEIAGEIGGHLFPQGDIAVLGDKVRRVLADSDLSRPALPGPQLGWDRRVVPMLRLLETADAEARARQPQTMSAAKDEVEKPAAGGFDLRCLPRAVLHDRVAAEITAVVGPGAHLYGPRVTRLGRHDLLSHLATAETGTFLIDWAGIEAAADKGDWAGLWSISDMRLNRQIMDACRIARDRGWVMQVRGPVHRSRAPLYRTVAGLLTEVFDPIAEPRMEAAQ